MKKSIFLILDNTRSLYNIGSLFRTADAFGVEKIYLCGISAYPVSRQMERVAKTALGAEKTVPWEYAKSTSSIVAKLKKMGIKIIALETGTRSKPLSVLRSRYPVAVIVGNEVTGIPRRVLRRCDAVVALPQQGTKESLNVAVAGAIALYVLRQSAN